MKKRGLIGIAAIGLAGIVSAQASPYVGFLLGYTNARIDTKTVNMGVVNRDNQAVNGFNGGLLAGYRFMFDFDKANLAAEAFGMYNGASHSQENGGVMPSKDKYELRSSYGVDILPGFYVAKNIDLFAIGGYQAGNFTFKRSGNNTFDKSKSLGGWDLGAGIEIALANHFSLRVQYKYTIYSNTTIVANSTFQRRFTPSANQFDMGVLYTFS